MSGNSPHPGVDDSYDKLSSSTGVRKGTISDTITAKTDIRGSTLYRLLGALGYSFAQFGAIFDAVTEQEIDDHIERLTKGK
ncbi:helix-turn-helix transcriptional regulator [Niabella sp. CC-SYL272]|uniref:helix-turn-helix domain-containing protein n=1 Tax=Niabella agricola TaxID=2891571 RepID=UPI001F29FAEA|nr:helix-turn-helix transcriptional regulator [Niabella agricola]MCF3111669.1 helix-turn-helix transcriptional regulator [Niabella agricola]